MNKIKKVAAAAAVGLIGAGLLSAPAQADWNDLTAGRVGFWTRSYAQGSMGAYRDPTDGGAWGAVLPSWLDYPKSLWNDSDRYTMYVYENPSCMSAGGRWYRAIAPGQKVDSTSGVPHWNSIQAFSFLQPTQSQRSCNGR